MRSAPGLAVTRQQVDETLEVRRAVDASLDRPTLGLRHPRLPRVLHDSPAAVLLVDVATTQVLQANPAGCRLAPDLGALPVQVARWSEQASLVRPDGSPFPAGTDPVARVTAGEPVHGEPVLLRNPAGERLVWVTGFPIPREGGGPERALAVFLDVDAGEAEIRDRAVVAAGLAFTISDARRPDNPLVFVNPAFERTTGYSRDEVAGRNCRFLQGPDTDREVVARIAEAVRRGEEHTAVLLNHRKDGSTWWNEVHLSPVSDDAGRLTHYLGFQLDVTARVVAEQQLLHLSMHDSLTGLANRAALLAHLDAVALTGWTGVLFLDLDGFKAVNDVHGHVVGDGVLAEVATRLRDALPAGHLLARHGGDEFVAVLSGLDPRTAESSAVDTASALVASLRAPFTAGDGRSDLGASVGVALAAPAERTGAQLLHDADTAMYRAKAARSDRVEVARPRQPA